MIIRQNLHTHTTYCDGMNPPQVMVLSAITKGLTSLGFSGHAYTPHDDSYCMSLENTQKYYSELIRLRKAYQDKISIYIGLEQDYYSVIPTIKTDYLIGSVHYVQKSGEYIPVDETAEITADAVNRLYDGDIYSYLEDYYKTVKDVYNKTGCDIVGHFNLPEKFNFGEKMFSRSNSRYVAAYESALETLIAQERIFEINSSGLGRYGEPYPNVEILKKIADMGGRVTVSADSHSLSTVDFQLNEMCRLAFECGFSKIYQLSSNGFEII